MTCYPEATPTLWGIPVVVVEENTLPPPGAMLVDVQRTINSADVIEGIEQIMSGHISMRVTDDDDGKEYKVKITLEPYNA